MMPSPAAHSASREAMRRAGAGLVRAVGLAAAVFGSAGLVSEASAGLPAAAPVGASVVAPGAGLGAALPLLPPEAAVEPVAIRTPAAAPVPVGEGLGPALVPRPARRAAPSPSAAAADSLKSVDWEGKLTLLREAMQELDPGYCILSPPELLDFVKTGSLDRLSHHARHTFQNKKGQLETAIFLGGIDPQGPNTLLYDPDSPDKLIRVGVSLDGTTSMQVEEGEAGFVVRSLENLAQDALNYTRGEPTADSTRRWGQVLAGLVNDSGDRPAGEVIRIGPGQAQGADGRRDLLPNAAVSGGGQIWGRGSSPDVLYVIGTEPTDVSRSTTLSVSPDHRVTWTPHASDATDGGRYVVQDQPPMAIDEMAAHLANVYGGAPPPTLQQVVAERLSGTHRPAAAPVLDDDMLYRVAQEFMWRLGPIRQVIAGHGLFPRDAKVKTPILQRLPGGGAVVGLTLSSGVCIPTVVLTSGFPREAVLLHPPADPGAPASGGKKKAPPPRPAESCGEVNWDGGTVHASSPKAPGWEKAAGSGTSLSARDIAARLRAITLAP